MTYQIVSTNKAVSVKGYEKKVGGFPNGSRLHSYPDVKTWSGSMRAKHGDKMPIKSHTRSAPTPTKREATQKKMNNSLAAKGSSKRIFINEKGKAKVTTKKKQETLMFNEKIRGKR